MLEARRHLSTGGVFYFNTTSSCDAQRTAALTFPHALRVLNFMAASDAPLVFDADRWERAITSTRSNGQLILDPETELGQRALGSLRALPRTYSATTRIALETRESVLARTPQCSLITDDNMRPEFLHPFAFPLVGVDRSRR